LSLKIGWKRKSDQVKNEILALYLAYRDPRVPRRAKIVLAAVLGYAVSPVDLVPDFIPVLGFLDDLIIVPIGIFLAVRMIPGDVWQECRAKAGTWQVDTRAKWLIAGVIMAFWLLLAGLIIGVLMRGIFH
jgi:uncharacterized membrane protein YkvA (DUF1232 family)